MLYMRKAYSKINIGLKVLGRDEVDGYHYLDMVTLPLEMHDRIEIEILPSDYDTILTCDEKAIPTDESNTVYKAVKAMREKFGFKQQLRIHIHKEIPHCAGLGGGSADAAAVILGLNELLKLKAKEDDLLELGMKVGSDVPLCIKNVPAHVTGKGEKVEPFKLKKSFYVLLCKPNTGLSTKDVYHKFDEMGEQVQNDNLKLIEGLKTDNDQLINENIGNDLQKPAIALNKDVEMIINIMKDHGCEKVFMTGSGAVVCGMSHNLKKLEDLEVKLKALKLATEITKTL